jgi:uncharacterized protein
MSLRIAQDLPSDLNTLIDTRVLIQANSGGGKSWCLRRLLEQTHGKVQHLVLDPEGEFSSLRERFDYVLAAKNGGDTAAEPRAAGLLAERLLELGVSAILDLYELKAHDRVRFVRLFLEALVDAPKKLWHPALIVVDETHVYCPQQGEAESATAVIDLATRGRKRGFCAVFATQRLSKLHKDAAAELNNKFIGRTGLDVDVKRAADELGFGKERWREMRDLDPGEFFVFGPALTREVQKVKIGPIKTTHPKAGARLAFTAPPPTAKIKALLPKLSDLPAEVEQKAKTEAELRKEIQGLRVEAARAKQAAPVKGQMPKRVEVPVLKEAQVKRLEALVNRAETLILRTIAPVREIFDRAIEATQPVTKAAYELSEVVKRAQVEGQPQPYVSSRMEAVRQQQRTGTGKVTAVMVSRRTEPAEGLTPAKQRLLDVLAFLETIGISQADKAQLALMADTRPTSGSYFNNLGALRTVGMIDYPRPGAVMLTEGGRVVANAEASPRTTDELHELLRGKLPPAKWRLIEVLIAIYPKAISKDDLAQKAGASATSGSYFNNLGSLRTLGLIDYPSPGQVIAQPILFLDR